VYPADHRRSNLACATLFGTTVPNGRSGALIAAACIAFLAWFSMKFHMDNSNDSETDAYVSGMIASAAHGTLSADATGHYTALAPYVLWPFTAALQPFTGAYQIRGFVLAYVALGLVLYTAAFLWYRRLGLGWLTSLLGLILLSTCLLFALLFRGWELDKLIEPALFLLGALAAWHRRSVALLVIAALAAANRESGVFFPLVVLAGLARQSGGLRAAIHQWPVWACLLICVAEAGWLRRIGPTPTVPPWADLTIERLVYVAGGLCFVPVLAAAWVRTASLEVKRLFWLLAPAWVVYELSTDWLVNGAVLLTPLALLFVPVALAGIEQVVPVVPAER